MRLTVRCLDKINGNQSAAFRAQRRNYGNNTDEPPEAQLNQCLIDLRSTDPRDDKLRIKSTKGGLLKDSSSWVFENRDFRQWRDDRNSQPLWITGGPGMGKTMLLCHIAEELSDSRTEEALVSYFFCQATDGHLNNATAVLRGLIYMLVKQDGSLRRYVYDEYKTAGKNLFMDINAWVALCRIFGSLIRNSGSSKLVFIIDALDECSEGLHSLLEFVVEHSATSRVKWLLSSRNLPHIEKALVAANRLCLELNQESIATAVGSYIEHGVAELESVMALDDEETLKMIKSSLTKKAENTFLWVALACQQLEKAHPWEPLSELERFPAGLDSLYKGMMDSISANTNAKLYHDILATVFVVRRPISLRELFTFLEESQRQHIRFRPPRDIVHSRGSFLTVQGDTVYFVHQSAKDYLITKATHTIIEATHFSTYSRSIEALISNNLQRLGRSLYNGEETATSPQSREDFQDGGTATGKGILDEKWSIGKDKTKRLAKLVYDGLRFIQSCSAVITESPLQVYASALIFSPNHSLVRCLFQKEEPEWIELKPIVDDTWNACLQTLEGVGDELDTVIFSPDSKIVASIQPNPSTIRLWSAETGTLLHTFKFRGYSWASSMAFSSDSKVVAILSHDGVIQLRSAETGALQESFKVPIGPRLVISTAYSPDGSMVAYGTHDDGVLLCSTKPQALRFTLSVHGEVHSVAFSPDGGTLASGLGDPRIQLWSTETGELLRELRFLSRRDSKVYVVTFSPDSKIVGAAIAAVFQLWSVETGTLQCRCTLDGAGIYGPTILSMAFSPDGKVVALAPYEDGCVQLRSAETGALRQKLEGHGSSSVMSVAFSSDGKTIAAGSWDGGAVQLLSTEAAISIQQPFEMRKDKSGMISSMALSPDGKVVATGSNDHIVRIWSAETGSLQHTLKHDSGGIERTEVLFSPNGKVVVSISRTARLWTVDTGVLRYTLGDATSNFSSAAFSPDGTVLALESRGRSIQLWSSETGLLQHKLIFQEQNKDYSSSKVMFSPSGKAVASKSSVIRVFSTQTGDLQHKFEERYPLIAFSPDYEVIALGFRDDNAVIELREAETGTLKRTFNGGSDCTITAMEFSPDSKVIASISNDKALRLFSTKTGCCYQTVDIDTRSWSISFSRDSKCLLLDNCSIALDYPSEQTPSAESALIDVMGPVIRERNFRIGPERCDVPFACAYSVKTRTVIASPLPKSRISCTKALVSASLDIPVQEQKVSWDSTTTSIVPEFCHMERPDILSHVTIQDICSHRTSLESLDEIPQGLDGQILVPKKNLIQIYNTLPVKHDLRTRYFYKNAMYTLAGQIIDRSSEYSNLGDFQHERIFKPLGMNRTTVFRSAHETDDNIATPYMVLTDAGTSCYGIG
ncbi:quinon protein alcohol dehydrogenase-like superfamily [Xylaria grammica]|nr:quinon protein alcohol dehydrogenase-like superfamily [Xylaria grammica]